MAKQKKEDTGELLVSLEQFTRTRDSVILSLTTLQTGLTHVQNGLTDLLRAYMQHTSSMITGGADVLETLQLPPHLTANANAAAEAAQTAATAVTQVLAAPEPGKKKRKREKKERDPDAPKRPLTAAFLFAQAARAIVRADLESSLGAGEKLEPNAVNLEVTKRWNEMPEEEKDQWKASYRTSMEKWKEENKSYLAKKGIATTDLHEEEEVSDEAGVVGALVSDADSDSDDDAAPIPAKAPTPPAANTKSTRPGKRQKTAASQVNGTHGPVPIAPAIAPSPVPLPGGGRHTEVSLPASSIEVPATAASKKDKKKKAGPQAIAPSPAAPKEASPDDTKKKGKGGRTTRNAEPEGEAAEKETKPAKKRDRSKRKSEGATA